MMDLHAAVLKHPDPLACVAAFAAIAHQQAHNSTAKLVAARLLQHLAAALQLFGPWTNYLMH
jgi:hypothetical protein